MEVSGTKDNELMKYGMICSGGECGDKLDFKPYAQSLPFLAVILLHHDGSQERRDEYNIAREETHITKGLRIVDGNIEGMESTHRQTCYGTVLTICQSAITGIHKLP